MNLIATIKVCDRCGKSIEYIGWTTKFMNVFRKGKTVRIRSLFNGNLDGHSYLDGCYELCVDCTKKLENFLIYKEELKIFKLVEPNEEIYALRVHEENFFLFDLFYSDAGYTTIDKKPIRKFETHKGYFIVDKNKMAIGFSPCIFNPVYPHKEYRLNDVIKKIDNEG